MVLRQIQDILTQQGYECLITNTKQPIPSERLLIFLELDSKNREYLIEILAIEQQIDPKFLVSQPIDPLCRLQFKVQLPFKIEDQALNQVASLLFFINPLLDVPGFELNELEGQVYYRHIQLIQTSTINRLIILSLINSIILNIRLFSNTIESLSDGTISFNNLLTQIINIAKK